MSVSAPSIDAAQRSRGEKLEGIAFQFCKIATASLIAGRYTLPVASGLCAVLYLWAYLSGKKDTCCWLRYPLLLSAVWGLVCAASIAFMVFPGLSNWLPWK